MSSLAAKFVKIRVTEVSRLIQSHFVNVLESFQKFMEKSRPMVAI